MAKMVAAAAFEAASSGSSSLSTSAIVITKRKGNLMKLRISKKAIPYGIYCYGLDSNGNIFIHGGNINVFSQAGSEGSDNEPVDHDGDFTLFDGTILAAGNKGMEYVHSGITKGNQMYAYYTGSIQANKILRVKNENSEIVKEATLPNFAKASWILSFKLSTISIILPPLIRR